jgi:hypothetical protein
VIRLHGRAAAIALALLAVTFAVTWQARSETPACAQARAIVAEVEELYASGVPDHALILGKLTTARNLCSTLGKAWKFSYCSALALGKEAEARIYRDRALFNNISDLACPSGDGTLIRPTVAPLPSRVRSKYALVVGIGRFKDPAIPTLRYAAKDAQDLAAVLKDPRYGRFDPANVTLLTDENATRANILNAMNNIILKAQEDDLAFIYVSSHGSPRQNDRGLGGVGYIVTSDTSLNNLWVDALEYESFSRQVSLLKARRKAVFLDTCFSGQIPRPGEKALFVEPAGIDPKTARLFLSGEGTYVITSSKANERSFESDSLRNSYFTHFLVKALQREGEPPAIREVFDFLKQEVPAAVAHDKGQPQNPQMVPAGGPGDLRIGVAPLAAPTNHEE